MDTLLGSVILPAERINQIRLVLGEQNSVVVDGVTHNLKVPSGSQSGLKLNVDYDLEPNVAYTVWIDYDACKSIVEKGNGTYGMKPVIRAYTELTNGVLTGVIAPDSISTTVHIIDGVDTISALPNDDGYFFVGGLNGVYDISVESLEPGVNGQVRPSISVRYGQVVSLDTIWMK